MRVTKDNATLSYHAVGERVPGPLARVGSYPARAKQFLHAVRLELRHVTWPTWADVRATTLVVIIAVFFFGFYLGTALDVPLAKLMNWLLRVGKGLVS